MAVWRNNELDIGYPTDVKHVAHIGWDGPSINGPGWVYIYTLLSEYFMSLSKEERKFLGYTAAHIAL